MEALRAAAGDMHRASGDLMRKLENLVADVKLSLLRSKEPLEAKVKLLHDARQILHAHLQETGGLAALLWAALAVRCKGWDAAAAGASPKAFTELNPPAGTAASILGDAHGCDLGALQGILVFLKRNMLAKAAGANPPYHLGIGDLLDRGAFQLPLLWLVWCAQLQFPGRVLHLVGNHESSTFFYRNQPLPAAKPGDGHYTLAHALDELPPEVLSSTKVKDPTNGKYVTALPNLELYDPLLEGGKSVLKLGTVPSIKRLAGKLHAALDAGLPIPMDLAYAIIMATLASQPVAMKFGDALLVHGCVPPIKEWPRDGRGKPSAPLVIERLKQLGTVFAGRLALVPPARAQQLGDPIYILARGLWPTNLDMRATSLLEHCSRLKYRLVAIPKDVVLLDEDDAEAPVEAVVALLKAAETEPNLLQEAIEALKLSHHFKWGDLLEPEKELDPSKDWFPKKGSRERNKICAQTINIFLEALGAKILIRGHEALSGTGVFSCLNSCTYTLHSAARFQGGYGMAPGLMEYIVGRYNAEGGLMMAFFNPAVSYQEVLGHRFLELVLEASAEAEAEAPGIALLAANPAGGGGGGGEGPQQAAAAAAVGGGGGGEPGAAAAAVGGGGISVLVQRPGERGRVGALVAGCADTEAYWGLLAQVAIVPTLLSLNWKARGAAGAPEFGGGLVKVLAAGLAHGEMLLRARQAAADEGSGPAAAPHPLDRFEAGPEATAVMEAEVRAAVVDTYAMGVHPALPAPAPRTQYFGRVLEELIKGYRDVTLNQLLATRLAALADPGVFHHPQPPQQQPPQQQLHHPQLQQQHVPVQHQPPQPQQQQVHHHQQQHVLVQQPPHNQQPLAPAAGGQHAAGFSRAPGASGAEQPAMGPAGGLLAGAAAPEPLPVQPATLGPLVARRRVAFGSGAAGRFIASAPVPVAPPPTSGGSPSAGSASGIGASALPSSPALPAGATLDHANPQLQGTTAASPGPGSPAGAGSPAGRRQRHARSDDGGGDGERSPSKAARAAAARSPNAAGSGGGVDPRFDRTAAAAAGHHTAAVAAELAREAAAAAAARSAPDPMQQRMGAAGYGQQPSGRSQATTPPWQQQLPAPGSLPSSPPMGGRGQQGWQQQPQAVAAAVYRGAPGAVPPGPQGGSFALSPAAARGRGRGFVPPGGDGGRNWPVAPGGWGAGRGGGPPVAPGGRGGAAVGVTGRGMAQARSPDQGDAIGGGAAAEAARWSVDDMVPAMGPTATLIALLEDIVTGGNRGGLTRWQAQQLLAVLRSGKRGCCTVDLQRGLFERHLGDHVRPIIAGPRTVAKLSDPRKHGPVHNVPAVDLLLQKGADVWPLVHCILQCEGLRAEALCVDQVDSENLAATRMLRQILGKGLPQDFFGPPALDLGKVAKSG